MGKEGFKYTVFIKTITIPLKEDWCYHLHNYTLGFFKESNYMPLLP